MPRRTARTRSSDRQRVMTRAEVAVAAEGVPTTSGGELAYPGGRAAVYTLDEARACCRLNHSIPAIAGNAGAR